MKAFKRLIKQKTPSKSDSSKTTIINPEEKPVQSKPLFSPNQIPSDFFSHPQMSDLAQVGKSKALGYLPLEQIRNSGFELFQVTLLLKKAGLKFFIIPNPLPEEMYAYNASKKKYIHIVDSAEYKVIPKGGFLSIRSGALVAYDEKAVNDLLEENEHLINKENSNESNPEDHWPLEAGDFVNMLFRKMAESVEMDGLVSKIFKEMPNQSELDLSMK
ncbi:MULTISPECIES: hypothetical protein [Legionella]|uniref:Dot/Icm T4SS effector n=1 Tax=Legionella resiliens TaxID=2905958 RepID=A0ABS8WYZ8_9GAMM|nr:MULTISPECIES: hypothetical protein [unclassified Legionella]MCE0722555.1 hypothetical protein [Legionella sp. 9fVS26]MCE3531708.1 hypothetical protein [Legionella sp. 8cVS16]QLZ67733.1 hypothetical protein FOLKNPGA_00506 [Legionella sp. PC1000]